MVRKPAIVFVGAFRQQARDGTVGGTAFACRSLVSSPLSAQVSWRLIDSTLRTWPPPGLVRRGGAALGRVLRFTVQVLDPRVRGALLFLAGGASLAEKGLMALIATGLGKPVVLAPRSGHLLHALERSPGLRRFARVVFASASRVMCQGAGWVEYYSRVTGLPAEHFASVPNWVDASAYTALERGAPLAPPGAPVEVLFLSRLERAKGVFDFVEAVARLGTEGAGARFVIGGEGPERAPLERELARLQLEGQASLPGWLKGPQKLAALAAADLFVFPSHVEGFPNTLLEAMAAGLPVVASDVGAVRELVTDGETGLLVPAGRSDALAAAMARLIREPALRQRLGAAARARVVQDFGLERGWQRVGAVLEAALAERVGPRRILQALRGRPSRGAGSLDSRPDHHSGVPRQEQHEG